MGLSCSKHGRQLLVSWSRQQSQVARSSVWMTTWLFVRCRSCRDTRKQAGPPDRTRSIRFYRPLHKIPEQNLRHPVGSNASLMLWRVKEPQCLQRRTPGFLSVLVNVNVNPETDECRLNDSQIRTEKENITHLFQLKPLICSSTLWLKTLGWVLQFTTLPKHMIELII